MNEVADYEYFKQYQLVSIDFTTGVINSKQPNTKRYFRNIGSKNKDGYIRVRCNGKLYMKHRLIYWLYHGVLPDVGEEIDHINSIRDDNRISNLQILSKSANNRKSLNRKFGKQMTKEEIHIICNLLANSNLSDEAIAKYVGRSRGQVRNIKTRKSRINISKEYSFSHRGY